jgi:site-specific recombinase XerD
MAIYQKGKHWYIDYYHKGHRRRKKVGTSKKLAETVLSDVQVKIVKEEYLGILEEKKVLFKEFSEIYKEYSKTNKARNSYARDLTSLNSLQPIFESRYLFEVIPQMVEEYKTKRLNDGVTPATINRGVSCLRHMFNKAVEWGFVRKNPVKWVKLLKEPPGRIRYLEVEEIERLLNAIDLIPRGAGKYLRPIVIIALNTGLRKQEILKMKWKNIDFNERKITVNCTKTNEIRILPMNESVYQELKKVPQHIDSEYVFCNKKGVPYGNVRKSFESALELAKVKDFRFHDLRHMRHTFASHLVMNGCDIRTVQQLMGHKEIKMTMIYSHLSKAHLQDAVGKLDNLWTLFGHQKTLCNLASPVSY